MTDALAIVKAELQPKEEETSSLLTECKAYTITNQAELTDAEYFIRAIKDRWDALEAKRVTITKPQTEALDAANALFQPMLKTLKACETILKTKIFTGKRALEAEQTAKLKLLGQQAVSGDVVAARETMLAVPTANLLKGTIMPEIWDFEVADIDKVEDRFLKVVVDVEKVQAAIKNGDRNIDGFRIFLRPSVTIRR